MKARLGVIGGSGLYDLPGLEDRREEIMFSPWGEPSAALRFGRIGSTEIVFLPRHGDGHRLSPGGINYRANIDALKRAGVTDIGASRRSALTRKTFPPHFRAARSTSRSNFRAGEQLFRQWLRCPCAVWRAVWPPPQAAGRRGSTIRERARAARRNCRLHGGTPNFRRVQKACFYKGQGYDVIGHDIDA